MDLEKMTRSEMAEELYRTKGKEFCTGLILHLVMFVSGSYEDFNKGKGNQNGGDKNGL